MQQHESGTDLLDERRCRRGEDHAVGHERVAKLHAIGSGTVHREKRLGRPQRDRGIGAVGQEHHDLTRRIFSLEDRAEIVIGTKIGDPGQRAAYDIATFDLAPPQLQSLDAAKALHRVGHAGAAENSSAGKPIGEFRCEMRVVGIRGKPDQRVLAPCQERGRAADLADRGDRPYGATQIGYSILRDVAPPGANFAEAAEQCIRINLAAVDCGGERRELLSSDGRHIIDDRPSRRAMRLALQFLDGYGGDCGLSPL